LKPKIVNIVAVIKLSSLLNLGELAAALSLPETSFCGNRWLKMRLMPENYYVAFYKSGKFLVTGVDSIEMMEVVTQKVLNLLKNARLNVIIKDTTIHNVVMTGTLKMNTSLEKIVLALDPSKASYEPEQFPGMIYKDFGVSFLLFPKGKFVLTGAKNSKSGEEATENFMEIIESIY
jgi:transcription initiation factor TFIID TATA-box-binding protein